MSGRATSAGKKAARKGGADGVVVGVDRTVQVMDDCLLYGGVCKKIMEYWGGDVDPTDGAMTRDILFKKMWDDRAEIFGEETVENFGKVINVPRRVGHWGSPYRYAGNDHPGKPFGKGKWGRIFQMVRSDLCMHLGLCTKEQLENDEFDLPDELLINLYEDGNSYIGQHSDGEKDIRSDKPILMICLGAVRPWRISTDKGKIVHTFRPGHGRVVVMNPGMQTDWKHGRPKVANSSVRSPPDLPVPDLVSMSLTFRWTTRKFDW
jgi:alkylated DNA repair dioxygenase AlkB